MAIDIEKEVDATVVKQEEPTIQESTTEVQADDSAEVRKENERLRRANKSLNQKVKDMETKEEVVEEVQQVDPNDKLATREGWLEEIDSRSAAKAKELVAPIYEANFRRAKDRFVKTHPEYATSKEKLTSLLQSAQAAGKMDEEDILDSMGQAWASANWRELQDATSKKNESRSRAQATTLNAASASEGSRSSEDYSDEDRDEAAKYGKSVETYKKAKALLEATSVNITS